MIKSLLAMIGIDARRLYQTISAHSIRAALNDQSLTAMVGELRRIVPDISDQYSQGPDAAEYENYWETKTRGLHAFQIECAIAALNRVGRPNLVLADMGDSSGNHGAYLRDLAPKGKLGRYISFNLDPVAVEKIKSKGGDAELIRAEDFDPGSVEADLWISFETLEHLTDPVRFLHQLAVHGQPDHLVVTVPYRRRSRFGGFHLRLDETRMPDSLTAEEVHVWELSPEDWQVLFRFSGFRTVAQKIYRQYPRYSPLRITEPMWRKLDFEGFAGFILERDLSVANRYQHW